MPHDGAGNYVGPCYLCRSPDNCVSSQVIGPGGGVKNDETEHDCFDCGRYVIKLYAVEGLKRGHYMPENVPIHRWKRRGPLAS